MSPRIEIWFADGKEEYEPGDVLECRFRVSDADGAEITSVEASIMWYTEGKGEEDLLVHRFERRAASHVGNELMQEQVIRATLPNSPLSYQGVILKLHWCVRIKAFAKQTRPLQMDRVFRLGKVPPTSRLPDLVRIDPSHAPAETNSPGTTAANMPVANEPPDAAS